MSYKENLYNKALHEIERIYVESKYDSDMDFYRIFDIINSVNDNQMANKEWLVDKLLPYIDPKGADICILGGWYGLTALMLKQHLPEEIEIDKYLMNSREYNKRIIKMSIQRIVSTI